MKNLKLKFWRKRIYNSVKRTAKVCLISYYGFSEQYPNATSKEIYRFVLKSRGITEQHPMYEHYERLIQESDSFIDIVHSIVSDEIPSELDSLIKTSTKSAYEYTLDGKRDLHGKRLGKPWETYATIYEILHEVIPESI